jgi:hypothetical protein
MQNGAMRHLYIIAFIAFILTAAIVGGVIYFDWSQQSIPRHRSSNIPISTPSALPSLTVGPPPAEAAPTITWTPSQVAETVGQGTQETKTVSFISTQDLINVVVWIAPALQPYVSANPSSLSSISKGAAVNLTLTFSAPAGAPLKTFDGTLHLRNTGKSQKTYAKPLPITLTITKATSDWQRFTDPQGRYSVMFPSDVKAQFVEDVLVLRLANIQEDEEAPSLHFSIDPNPDGLTVEEFYDGSPERNLIGQSEEFTFPIDVGGVPSFKFVPIISFAGETIIIVPRDREFLKISDYGNSFQKNGLFESIINTVEF